MMMDDLSPNTTNLNPKLIAGKSGQFDSASFVGGVISALALICTLFFACKFYRARKQDEFDDEDCGNENRRVYNAATEILHVNDSS